MIRAKNKFYKQLKLNKKEQKVLKFFRNIQEIMLKDVDCLNYKNKEREK